MKAKFQRNIKSGREYDPLFGKPKFTRDTLMNDAEPKDTVREMERMVWETLPQTEKISAKVRGNTQLETEKNIFWFIYDHIQYKEDSEHAEEIHEPNRTWAERTTGKDCDDMAAFAMSMLLNNGIEASFRIAAYELDKDTKEPVWAHVYVVTKNGTIIDPVLDKFNKEEPYLIKKDFPMRLDRLGKPKQLGDASSIMEFVGQTIDKLPINGESAGGKALDSAMSAASQAVTKAKSQGGKIEWHQVTGIVLAVGCAAVGQCFGIPAPVGAAIGKALNELIKWVVSLFKKEKQPPSGWKYNSEDKQHNMWVQYVMDSILTFNNYYITHFAKADWDANKIDVPSGKPQQEVFKDFPSCVWAGVVWLTSQNKDLTPLNKDKPSTQEGVCEQDFQDWLQKTGRWSVYAVYMTYLRDRAMITDFKLFKQLVDEANANKVSFSQRFNNYLQERLWNGKDGGPDIAYTPNLNDANEFAAYLTGSRATVPGSWQGDIDKDYRFFPYGAPMRTPYDPNFSINMVDPNTFYFFAFQYDRITKLDPNGPFGIDGKDQYVKEAQQRNKSVFYVIAQYIGWDIQNQAENGKKTDFKLWVQQNQKNLDDWRQGKGVWTGKKCTKLVVTQEGQVFLWDTGEFPNPDAFMSVQEQWTSEISTPQPMLSSGSGSTGANDGSLPAPPPDGTQPEKTGTETGKEGFVDKAKKFIKENPAIAVLGAGAVILGGAYALGAFSPKKPKTGTKKPLNGTAKKTAALGAPKKKKKSSPRQTVKQQDNKKILVVKLA